MTPEQFQQRIRQQAAAIRKCVSRTLPVKIGRAAKDHFQANFEKGGYMDGGLHAWKRSNRIGRAKGAAGSYSTLLSGRNHLFSSIEYKPEPGKVTISSSVPYARVHNEGGRAGRGRGFRMPKRQFMGESRELSERIEDIVDEEISKILKP